MPLPLIDELKKNCTKIHFFGLGFIQVKLDERQRWHFYTKKLKSFVDDPHNHRYDFMSTVLYGSLSQTIWDAKPAGVGTSYEPTHIMYDVTCKEGEKEQMFGGFKVAPITSMTFAKDSYYHLPRDTYHTIAASGDAITMIFLGDKLKEKASVLRLIDKEAVCPFSQPQKESELWDIVGDMIKTYENCDISSTQESV
jgi:hypothetical protein